MVELHNMLCKVGMGVSRGPAERAMTMRESCDENLPKEQGFVHV